MTFNTAPLNASAINVTAGGAGATAVLEAEIPAPLMEGNYRAPIIIAPAEWMVPAPLMVARATARRAALEAAIPAPLMEARAGARLVAAVPAPLMEARGVTGGTGWLLGMIPAPLMVARAISYGRATLEAAIPAPLMAAWPAARLVAAIPAPLMEASATAPAIAMEETTYVINIATGAVTQWIIGPADKLVSAHGRLYAVRAGALVCLDGDTDDGEPIPVTLRFAPQDFGSNSLKSLSEVYLSAREWEGVTLEVVADETTAYRYQNGPESNAAPAFGTCKVYVGKGIRAHSIGLIARNRNGGELDIGRMEIPVNVLSRKPR